MADKKITDNKIYPVFYLLKLFSLTELLINRGTWIAMAYFTYLSIKEIAGKNTTTSLSFVIRHLVEFKKGCLILGFFAILCCIWALRERKLRKRQIKKLQGHNKELELRMQERGSTA